MRGRRCCSRRTRRRDCSWLRLEPGSRRTSMPGALPVAVCACNRHARIMSGAEPMLPPDRLERRVVAYWILGDSITALVLSSLAWFGLRPLLANNWDGWSPGWESALRIACIVLIALAVLAPPLAYARWRY